MIKCNSKKLKQKNNNIKKTMKFQEISYKQKNKVKVYNNSKNYNIKMINKTITIKQKMKNSQNFK